jgi:hypothetical protein
MWPRRAALVLSVLLLGVASSSGAGIHTWVDADGDRHYGDRVPQRYRSRSRPVEPERAPVVERVRPDLPEFRLPRTDESAQAPEPVTDDSSTSDREDLNCTQRKRAWRRSKACFEDCRQEIRDGGWNNARCGHCREMTPPDC